MPQVSAVGTNFVHGIGPAPSPGTLTEGLAPPRQTRGRHASPLEAGTTGYCPETQPHTGAWQGVDPTRMGTLLSPPLIWGTVSGLYISFYLEITPLYKTRRHFARSPRVSGLASFPVSWAPCRRQGIAALALGAPSSCQAARGRGQGGVWSWPGSDALLFSRCSLCSWPSEWRPGQVKLTHTCTSVVSCSDVW